jgi:drug/metabolite transporter (DMT)-like permease
VVSKKSITAALVGGVAAISTSAVLIRLAGAPPAVIAFYRMFFATLFFTPLALKQSPSAALSRGQLLLALGAGTLLAGHFLFWMTSLEYTSVASSVVLVTTQPLWVFLISVLFLGEKPTRLMWTGLFVALLGGVLVTLSQSQAEASRLFGNMLALGGAVMMAGYLAVGRSLRRDLSLSLYSAIIHGTASVVLALYVWIGGLPLRGYTCKTWLIFGALALVPTVLGHNSLNWALRYLPATMVSIVVLGEPVGASILAILALGEIPSLLEVLGSFLTLLGIFFVWRGGAGQTSSS